MTWICCSVWISKKTYISRLAIWNKGNLHSFPKERLTLFHKKNKKKASKETQRKISSNVFSSSEAWNLASWAHVTFLFSCNPNSPKFLFLCFPKVSIHVFSNHVVFYFSLYSISAFFPFLCFAFLCSKHALYQFLVCTCSQNSVCDANQFC